MKNYKDYTRKPKDWISFSSLKCELTLNNVNSGKQNIQRKNLTKIYINIFNAVY